MKYILLVLFVGFLSCNKETLEFSGNDDDYFPLEVGNWIEYSVTLITINMRGNHDTATIQLREEVSAIIDSSAAEINYRILQKTRAGADDEWTEGNAVLVTRLPKAFVRQEENCAELVLIPNAEKGDYWNRYAYDGNTDTTLYTVLNQYGVDTLGSETFDSLLVVEKEYVENLVDVDTHVEKYAPGIGLVYSEKIAVSSSEVEVNVPVMERLDNGCILIKEYCRHGKK